MKIYLQLPVFKKEAVMPYMACNTGLMMLKTALIYGCEITEKDKLILTKLSYCGLFLYICRSDVLTQSYFVYSCIVKLRVGFEINFVGYKTIYSLEAEWPFW
jgi:hypothetical protein